MPKQQNKLHIIISNQKTQKPRHITILISTTSIRIQVNLVT